MASVMGKIVNSFMRTMTMNPLENKNQLKTLNKVNKLTWYKPPKGYEQKKIVFDDLPIEIIRKKESKNKNVIYLLHGGAYVSKLHSLYRLHAKGYCKAGHDASVIYIDYRVAPEHKYPAALEDAIKGWDWMSSQGYKEENIIVIGDSAGGHLTLSLMLKLREMGRKMPKAAICLSPWADMTSSADTYVNNYNKDVLLGNKKGEFNDEIRDMLSNSDMYSFCHGKDLFDPYISPVYADYSGFPPMLLIAGGNEMVAGDSITIAEKLQKAGSEVTLEITPGMFHVFPLYAMIIPEAKRALKMIHAFMGKHLSD